MNKGTLVLWSSIGLGFLGASANCTIVESTGADAGTGGAFTGTGGSGGTAGTGGAAVTGGAAGTDGAVDTGGSSGTGGTSADAASDVTVVVDAGSDPCTSPDPGNEDRDHATPYPLGAAFPACLQTASDVDFYEFITPATPVGGGVVVVNLTEVGTGGGIDSASFATSDNGEIEGNFGAQGTSVYYWFGVVPATRYRIRVASTAQGNMANPYTLRATFLGVDDTFEANDTRATAKTIALGTAAHGFMFAGFASSVAPAEAAWLDWFKVTLAAGSATFTLTDVPSEFTGSFTIYDSNGSTVGGTAIGSNDGANFTTMRTGLAAGDYTINVEPFGGHDPRGNGSTLPQYSTQPYTFTVTQP